MGAKTYNWKEISDQNYDSEELLLTNTFLNSKNQEIAQLNDVEDSKEKKNKLKWVDEIN